MNYSQHFQQETNQMLIFWSNIIDTATIQQTTTLCQNLKKSRSSEQSKAFYFHMLTNNPFTLTKENINIIHLQSINIKTNNTNNILLPHK